MSEEEKKIEKPLTARQKNFLKILKAKGGNVAATCETFGITRQTHYDWLENLTYKKIVEDIQESLLDFSESQLVKKIKEGDNTCIIFHLKTKGRNRGYIERSQLDMEGNFNNTNKNNYSKEYIEALNRQTKAIEARNRLLEEGNK